MTQTTVTECATYFFPSDVLHCSNMNTDFIDFRKWHTVKPIFFACPLFCEFRKPGKFAKITGRENLYTVAFQCSRKQKRQNYGVQNNYIDSNAKIKCFTVVTVI